MAGGRERGHVRQLTAGDETADTPSGRPSSSRSHSSATFSTTAALGPAATRPAFLVPRRREPVGRECSGQRAADDEPEVTPTWHRDHAWLGSRYQLCDDLRVVGPALREAAQRLAQLFDRGLSANRPPVERAENCVA